MEYNKIFKPSTIEKLNKKSAENLKTMLGNKTLMQTMISSQTLLNEIEEAEKPYRDILEALAVEMVEKIYPIVEQEGIQIDAKIVGMDEINATLDEIKINKPSIFPMKVNINGWKEVAKTLDNSEYVLSSGSDFYSFLSQLWWDPRNPNIRDKDVEDDIILGTNNEKDIWWVNASELNEIKINNPSPFEATKRYLINYLKNQILTRVNDYDEFDDDNEIDSDFIKHITNAQDEHKLFVLLYEYFLGSHKRAKELLDAAKNGTSFNENIQNLFESITPESRRRIINGISQGAALKGAFSFYLFKEYLDDINPDLIEKYNQIMKNSFGIYDDENAIAMLLSALAQGQKGAGGSSKVIINEIAFNDLEKVKKHGGTVIDDFKIGIYVLTLVEFGWGKTISLTSNDKEYFIPQGMDKSPTTNSIKDILPHARQIIEKTKEWINKYGKIFIGSANKRNTEYYRNWLIKDFDVTEIKNEGKNIYTQTDEWGFEVSPKQNINEIKINKPFTISQFPIEIRNIREYNKAMDILHDRLYKWSSGNSLKKNIHTYVNAGHYPFYLIQTDEHEIQATTDKTKQQEYRPDLVNLDEIKINDPSKINYIEEFEKIFAQAEQDHDDLEDDEIFNIANARFKKKYGHGIGEDSKKYDLRESESPKITIKARALNFPMLVHEIIKGLYELISLQGFKGDKETNQKTADSVDLLKNEPHDIKYGKFIYNALNDVFSASKYNDPRIREFFFIDVYKLEDDEFLSFIENAINEELTPKQKQWVDTTLKEIAQDLKDDDWDSNGIDEIKVKDPSPKLKLLGNPDQGYGFLMIKYNPGFKYKEKEGQNYLRVFNNNVKASFADKLNNGEPILDYKEQVKNFTDSLKRIGIEYKITEKQGKFKLGTYNYTNIYIPRNKVEFINNDENIDEIKINNPSRPIKGKLYDIKTWFANYDDSLDNYWEPAKETIPGDEGWYWSKDWIYGHKLENGEIGWSDLNRNDREYDPEEEIRPHEEKFSEIKVNNPNIIDIIGSNEEGGLYIDEEKIRKFIPSKYEKYIEDFVFDINDNGEPEAYINITKKDLIEDIESFIENEGDEIDEIKINNPNKTPRDIIRLILAKPDRRTLDILNKYNVDIFNIKELNSFSNLLPQQLNSLYDEISKLEESYTPCFPLPKELNLNVDENKNLENKINQSIDTIIAKYLYI